MKDRDLNFNQARSRTADYFKQAADLEVMKRVYSKKLEKSKVSKLREIMDELEDSCGGIYSAIRLLEEVKTSNKIV